MLTTTQFWLILGSFPLLFAIGHDLMQEFREARPFRASRREVRNLVGGVPAWRRLIKR